ncbi:MAG TPA: flagellar biosynthetic protein FliQ [Peptococcaceae bacterium]|nr:flagellar biosynthetic protein FliQ [Peptococcaceae bacterium]
MTEGQIMDILKEAMLVAFKLAGPLLIVSIVVGLIVSIFQAATQIHEQTLTFVPKVVCISLLLLILGSWMIGTMGEFVQGLFLIMENL